MVVILLYRKMIEFQYFSWFSLLDILWKVCLVDLHKKRVAAFGYPVWLFIWHYCFTLSVRLINFLLFIKVVNFLGANFLSNSTSIPIRQAPICFRILPLYLLRVLYQAHFLHYPYPQIFWPSFSMVTIKLVFFFTLTLPFATHDISFIPWDLLIEASQQNRVFHFGKVLNGGHLS